MSGTTPINKANLWETNETWNMVPFSKEIAEKNEITETSKWVLSKAIPKN